MRGCIFCSCQQFHDVGEVAEQVPSGLSGQAQRAFEVLTQAACFKHVNRERLALIAQQGRRRLFLAGTALMRQGGQSDSLHLLVRGHVRVEREVAPGKSVVLAELGPGDVVGEMGVLKGDPRTATVTALEDLETFELSAGQMKVIFQQCPDVLMAVMKVINERIKSTDDLVETVVQVTLAQLGNP